MLQCFEDDPTGRIHSDSTVKAFKSDYQEEIPVIPRCGSCGRRIRGENHENGEHHNKVRQCHTKRR